MIAMQEAENTNDNVQASDVKADAVEEDKEREKAMPSNILEKGIIYFFVSAFPSESRCHRGNKPRHTKVYEEDANTSADTRTCRY